MKNIKGIVGGVVVILYFSFIFPVKAASFERDIIVTVSEPTAFQSLLKNVALVSVYPLLGNEIYKLTVERGDINQVLQVLKSIPSIASAIPDAPISIAPNKTEISVRLKGLNSANLWWQESLGDIEYEILETNTETEENKVVTTLKSIKGADIDLKNAHAVERGSSEVFIGLIDSGVDLDHPALINSIYINNKEIPNNGIDDDRNGHIDDINGWNFVANSPDVQDFNGHGTSVAGVLAGQSETFNGVCPECKILPIIVSSAYVRSTLIPPGYLFLSSFITGVDYLVEQKVKVINMSFYFNTMEMSPEYRMEFLKTTKKVFEYTARQGVLTVVAAGNSGAKGNPILFPSAFPEVISVGGTNFFGEYASFSGFGPWVDILAPASVIWTTQPQGGSDLEGQEFDKTTSVPGFNYASGTSFATPMVAGAAALLFSHYPKMSASNVRATLLSRENTNLILTTNKKPKTRKLNVFKALINPKSTPDDFDPRNVVWR